MVWYDFKQDNQKLKKNELGSITISNDKYN